MARDVEVRALGQSDDRLLQPVVLESDDPPALLADDVMVMVPARVDPLVSGCVAT